MTPMPVLAWYFCRRLGAAAAMLWLGLTALFAGLYLVANPEEDAALLLAFLTAPRLALDILPFACAIAAAACLQRMEESRELQTMRAAGLSWGGIAALAAGGGTVFAVLALALGEMALEPAESLARAVKNRQTVQGNIWLHRGGKFFYAEQIALNGEMQNIAVYEPRADSLRIISATSAAPLAEKDAWRLTDGKETEMGEGRAQTRDFTARESALPFAAAALRAVVRRPREMSMRSLAAAGVLQEGGIGGRYAAAFWRKLASIPAPPMLFACAIWAVGMRRRAAVAALTATGIAGAYYLAAVMAAQFAVLLNFPAFAAAPLLLLGGFLALAVRRRFS